MSQLDQGEFTAELNGLRLWYKVSGRGPACLFPSPGWGPSSDLYFNTLKGLEEHFTVVYLDSRGSGRSEAPPEPTGYRYDDFAADLEALRVHLGCGPVWAAGHSMAGILAMRFALMYPPSCAGLVLIDSDYLRDKAWKADAVPRRARRENEPWYKEALAAQATVHDSQEKIDQAVRMGLLFAFHDVTKASLLEQGDPPPTPTPPNSPPPNSPPPGPRSSSSQAMRGVAESNKGQPVLPLEQIKAPTLILVGASDDRCSIFQATRLHLGIAGSKLMVIEEAGHFPWLEQPEAFFAAVRSGLAALGATVTAYPPR